MSMSEQLSSTGVDPVIAALADPRLIASRAVRRYRHRRPTVEKFIIHDSYGGQETVVEPFTLDVAIYDTMARRSLVPEFNLAHMNQALEIARTLEPEYLEIDRQRIQKASVDQQR